MGQAESTEDEFQSSIFHAQVSRQVSILREMAHLSYQDFVHSVDYLNNLTKGFLRSSGRQLMFIIKGRSDESFLWKGTVRINCVKVNITTNRVECSRSLSLRQFMLLKKEIIDKSQLPGDGQRTRADTLTASIILEEAETIGSVDDDTECCICMDNPSELILPCEHRFCESCIDSWNFQQKTCPLCRADVCAKKDAWVLTEKPSSVEYASDVKGYIMGLAGRLGEDNSVMDDS